MPDPNDLKTKILSALDRSPGSTARDISNEISEDRKTVNQFLYSANGISVRQDSNFRWFLHSRVLRLNKAATAMTSEDQILESIPEYRPEAVNGTIETKIRHETITNALTISETLLKLIGHFVDYSNAACLCMPKI